LEAYALRHKTIATNLANITTTGYRAKAVQFEETLAGALQQNGGMTGVRTHKNHLPIGGGSVQGSQPQIVEASETGAAGDPLASGVNDVDLDHEMAELAKNQIRFRFSARLLAETFRGIQKSIRGTQ
jgi:flagellar basal-body rod protein FlgB